MSAIGTKRTSPGALHMSAFGCKADIVAGVPGLARVGLMQSTDTAA